MPWCGVCMHASKSELRVSASEYALCVCIVWVCMASCSNFLTTVCKLVGSGKTLSSDPSHNLTNVQANTSLSSDTYLHVWIKCIVYMYMYILHVGMQCVGKVCKACLKGNVVCLRLALSGVRWPAMLHLSGHHGVAVECN